MGMSANVHWWETPKCACLSTGARRRAARSHRSRLTTRGPDVHNAIYVSYRSRNTPAIKKKNKTTIFHKYTGTERNILYSPFDANISKKSHRYTDII